MAKAEVIQGLDCYGPARDGIGLVLTRRLEEMCSLRERALDFSDPEGVHDMRVSSRRLRSALRDFSPYLKKNKLSESIDELKTLADALGQVRDDDVAIMELEKIRRESPPERASDIQKLIDIRDLRRSQARRSLQSLLASRKLNRLKRSFYETLPEALVAPKRKKDETTYFQIAGSIIGERVGELRELARSLHNPHRTKPLHRMRIAAKRLRYAVELFAPCWGDRSLSFARQIANLQLSLGGVHDCDVWIEYFGDWLSEKRPEVDLQTDSQRDAMVWLLGHFTKLRAKYFRTALSQWRDWERKDFLAKLLHSHTEEAVARAETAKQTATSTDDVASTVTSDKQKQPKVEELLQAKTKSESVIENAKRSKGSAQTKPPKSAPPVEAAAPEVIPVKRDVTLEELNGKEESGNNRQQGSAEERTDEQSKAVRVVRLDNSGGEGSGNSPVE